MSDTSQGPGWWRASNGLWYPPEAKPGARQPRGVPERAPADPGVQEPFTLRPMEPLELERDRRPHRERRHALPDERPPRRVPWGWIGSIVLVVVFAGIGLWLAATVNDRDDSTAEPTGSTATGETSVVESTTTTSPAASTTSTLADGVSVFELAVGDCFSPAPDAGDEGATDDALVLTTVEVVDCGEPHLAEVIAVGQLATAAGQPFPGEAPRDAEALGLCQPAVETYVGVPLASSDLGLIWLAPTAATWEDDDDREVTCAVQSLDGSPLVGSVAGTGR